MHSIIKKKTAFGGSRQCSRNIANHCELFRLPFAHYDAKNEQNKGEIMQQQFQWLDMFKRQKGFVSDYQLAKHWQLPTATISQYRTGRLKLPVAYCLEIAEVCYFHPLEVILSLEYPRARDAQKERIKQVYFLATAANEPDRMSARAFSTKYYKRR